MKEIRLRIPLNQYSYIEYDFEGTPEEAIDEVNNQINYYNNASQRAKNGSKTNLEPKELRRVTDTFFLENRMEEEDNSKLGTEKIYSQQDLFKWASNSFARIKAKGEVGTRAEDPYRTITRD